MAKASQADLDMAMELCGALDCLGCNWPSMPEAISRADDGGDGTEGFDLDDDAQCGRALRHLLGIADRGSLTRVVGCCVVVLDPRNKCVDPAADTIEHHPDRARLAALNAQLLEALKACQNYVATQAVGCHGDKCREPWCYSCSGDDEAGAEARKGMLAYQLVCAAIAAATEGGAV